MSIRISPPHLYDPFRGLATLIEKSKVVGREPIENLTGQGIRIFLEHPTVGSFTFSKIPHWNNDNGRSQIDKIIGTSIKTANPKSPLFPYCDIFSIGASSPIAVNGVNGIENTVQVFAVDSNRQSIVSTEHNGIFELYLGRAEKMVGLKLREFLGLTPRNV